MNSERIFNPLAKYELMFGTRPKKIMLSEQVSPKTTDKPIQVIEIEWFIKDGEESPAWHGISEALFWNLSMGYGFFKKLVSKV